MVTQYIAKHFVFFQDSINCPFGVVNVFPVISVSHVVDDMAINIFSSSSLNYLQNKFYTSSISPFADRTRMVPQNTQTSTSETRNSTAFSFCISNTLKLSDYLLPLGYRIPFFFCLHYPWYPYLNQNLVLTHYHSVSRFFYFSLFFCSTLIFAFVLLPLFLCHVSNCICPSLSML